MTDEIEIPDPLGDAGKPKTTGSAPEGFDATVIEPSSPILDVPEIRAAPVEPVMVEPEMVKPFVYEVPPAVQVPPVEIPQFTEAPRASSYTPPPAETPKKNNTIWWVVGIVVLLLLCCCCSIVAVFWFTGDEIIKAIESSFLPTALALLA